MKLDPRILDTFQRNFAAAQQGGVGDATAMVLSTRHEDGHSVATRTVLLKAVDETGFVFFTNALSNKGRQLALFPVAALLFPWYAIEQQVIVEGRVSVVDTQASDTYFASRARDSQIGAWASQQSQPLTGRAQLEQAVAAAEQRFAGEPVSRPEHWQGYRVEATMVEFWYGRPHRLHDRHRWQVDSAGQWRETLLYP